MTAYVIFIREKLTDEQALATYTDLAVRAGGDHPITVLTAYDHHEVWEGDPCDAVLILSFPDGDAAKRWYHSEAYQAARQHRFKGADYRVIFTENAGHN